MKDSIMDMMFPKPERVVSDGLPMDKVEEEAKKNIAESYKKQSELSNRMFKLLDLQDSMPKPRGLSWNKCPLCGSKLAKRMFADSMYGEYMGHYFKCTQCNYEASFYFETLSAVINPFKWGVWWAYGFSAFCILAIMVCIGIPIYSGMNCST